MELEIVYTRTENGKVYKIFEHDKSLILEASYNFEGNNTNTSYRKYYISRITNKFNFDFKNAHIANNDTIISFNNDDIYIYFNEKVFTDVDIINLNIAKKIKDLTQNIINYENQSHIAIEYNTLLNSRVIDVENTNVALKNQVLILNNRSAELNQQISKLNKKITDLENIITNLNIKNVDKQN